MPKVKVQKSAAEKAFYEKAERKGYLETTSGKVSLVRPGIGKMSAEDRAKLHHKGVYATQAGTPEARKAYKDTLRAMDAKYKKK